MFKVDITKSKELEDDFKLLRNDIKGNLTQAFNNITNKLTNRIKYDKLSGSVLKARSGKLRSSIKSQITSSNDVFNSVVSADSKYASVHENGFNGSVNIRAHLRKIKQAFGRSIAPTEVNIGSHTRLMNIKKRSFMASALNELKQEIELDIEKAVKKSL